MPSRPTLGPGSGTIPGTTFFTEYETAMKGLWDASNLPLHSVGGTADNVTATCDWPLQAGFVDGMKFTITWAADNTGPMTLSINGAQAVDVKSADGSALLSGDMKAGTRVLLEYIGGEFRVLGGSGEGGTEPYYTVITASGTWAKPPGFGSDARVIIEAWGGGAGGGSARRGSTATSYSGVFGGGGAYHRLEMRYANVPASVPVTIGAGGAAGAAPASGGGTTAGGDGGNTSFGAYVFAARGLSGANGESDVSIWEGGGAFGGGQGGAGIPGSGGAQGTVPTNGGGAGGQVTPTGTGTAAYAVGGPGDAPGGGGGAGTALSASPANVDRLGGDGARGEVRIWIVG